MNGMVAYPNPFGSGLRRICSNAAPLSVSDASATVVSNPPIPNVRFMPCWIRATALSMARPAVDVSSGRNGEPVCPAPYTAPWSASRTPRQRAELSRAAQGDGGSAHPAACWSSRSRAESNCAKNAESFPRTPSVFTTSGFTPRLAPLPESCSEARVPARDAYVLLEPRHDGDVAAAHRIPRERGPELQASRVGELVVPGHDARVERHAQDTTGGDVGALDRLRSEHGPAREGGADEEEDNAQASHQQNGTRRMADAVCATPRHGWSSSSGHGGNRRAVLGVDRPHELPRDQAMGRLDGVNTVAAERQPEG